MIDSQTSSGDSRKPLFEAIREGSLERVGALLRDDPSLVHALEPEDHHGARALHRAVGRGGTRITELLLDRGADPNAADAFGSTPLHMAVGAEMPPEEVAACIRLLLSHGADPGAVNHNGHTPRRDAVWSGDALACRLLEEQQAPLHGQRPTWEAPEEVVRRVERILMQAWEGPVVLGACYQLRGDRVLRFEVAGAPEGEGGPASGSVVVKRARGDEKNPYNPDATERNPAWRLFEDWAGTQLFSSLPHSEEYGTRFYGGDREAGILVIEDLGDGEALVDRLMGDDSQRAEEGLRMLAECVGRMHAETIGQQERYRRYRDALGPRVERSEWRLDEKCRERLLKGFSTVGIEPAAGFEAEFEQLAAAMENPGPFLAYTHCDPCPDNCRIVDRRLRLFDFEISGFRHAMLDAVYGRITFPTCWCVNRLPSSIAPMKAPTGPSW